MLEELWQTDPTFFATFRRSRNKGNVGRCWLKTLTGLKPRAKGRNNSQHCCAYNVACRWVRVAVVCKRLQQLSTTQQHATGCTNGRNMYHPTMLRVVKLRANERKIVGQQLSTLLHVTCCVRLHTLLRVLGVVAQSLIPVKVLAACKRRHHCWLIRVRANGRNNFQHCCANNVGSCCVRFGSGVQMDATTPNKFGTYIASWKEYNP